MEKNNKELEEKEVAGASGGVIVPTTVIAKQGNFLPAFDGDVDQNREINVEELRGASGGRVWMPKKP